MGSALNLAAKGSQFVIQGANSLAQNVHAGTRQPSPAGHSQSIAPAKCRASRAANPSGMEREKQDQLTLKLRSLATRQHPFHAVLPHAFFPL